MKISRAPVSIFVLVSMARYCQERGTQVLNDFAAVRTFLLKDEEAVSRWPRSLSRRNPATADRRSFRNCN